VSDGEQTPGEPVGSLGDEAAKLLLALQGWAKGASGEHADATEAAAAGATSAFHRVNEHLATGGETCRYCPVCQVINAFRQTSPEVREHLASAAASLLQAAAGVMATQVPQPRDRRRDTPVEKIDLDDGEDG